FDCASLDARPCWREETLAVDYAAGKKVKFSAYLRGNGMRAVAGRKALLFGRVDRKSTRLNSSHVKISYAVFCLKKKKRSRAGSTSAYIAVRGGTPAKPGCSPGVPRASDRARHVGRSSTTRSRVLSRDLSAARPR